MFNALNQINESKMATPAEISDTKSIITKFAQDTNQKYDDVVTRLKGLTAHGKIARKDMDVSIDVLPLLQQLSSAGYIKTTKSGSYARTDAISQVFRQRSETALKTDDVRDAVLPVTQDAYKQANDPTEFNYNILTRGYKRGNDKSNVVRSEIMDVIKANDPSWSNLTDSDKDMLVKMRDMQTPYQTAILLRTYIHLQKSKKNYRADAFFKKNLSYAGALNDLINAGVIDGNSFTLNKEAVNNMRNVIEFLKSPPPNNIPPNEKISVFLPNFLNVTNNSISAAHNIVSSILKNPKYAKDVSNITNLTDDELTAILSKNKMAYNQFDAVVNKLADTFNVNTVSELKKELANKLDNMRDTKGENNRNAKSTGKADSFIKHFNI